MLPPLPPVILDWRAYWTRFQQAHGGDPVPHRGRLLFRDGWSYSASDHAGPEWPPPADSRELRDLRRAYWTGRKVLVAEQHDDLEQLLGQLETMQRAHSVPLVTVRATTGEDGRRASERADLDLGALKGRLAWLAQDLTECDRQLVLIDQED